MTRRAWLMMGMATTLLVPGCSGESSDTFAAQTLTRVDQGGANGCVNGGVSIASGVDDNQNGVLDDDEVDEKDTRVVCAGDSAVAGGKLERVDVVPSGADCPGGGVAIKTGKDANANGKLEDSEVDVNATQLVCTSTEHAVLTRATALPVGSDECPFGGRRIEAGLDNGDGNAKPDDNDLADGEVDSSYLDCNASAAGSGDMTPPKAPAGKSLIDVRGGAAIDAQAGAGGQLSAEARQDIQCVPETTLVFPTGTVDASFAIPTITANLGPVPLVVKSDLALPLYEASDLHDAGTYYYSNGSSTIVLVTADGNQTVTGLRVAEGAKLTLPNNSISVSFANDVEVLGTIAPTSGEVRSLSLTCESFLVGAKGVVEMTQAQSPAGQVTISAFGRIAFRGTLQAQGVNGVSGATASFHSSGRTYLSGHIDVSGGNGVSGYGGAAGSFRASTSYGGLWSSAKIDANGGDGSISGGQGGSIVLGPSEDERGSNNPRDLRSSGALSAHGGTQSGCPNDTSCNGGAGGEVRLHALFADLLSSGAISADGGKSDQTGGTGGVLALKVLNGSGPKPTGVRLALTGNLLSRGGAAVTSGWQAGAGGSVVTQNCAGDGSTVELLGYTAIELGGGAAAGQGSGGQGGGLDLGDALGTGAARRMALYVPVHATGGKGYSAGGGGHVSVNLSTYTDAKALPPDMPALVVATDLDARGGDSDEGGGGYAGYVDLRALGSLELSGSIRTSGGTTAGDAASYGGYILALSTLGNVDSSATLTASGANATKYGGGRGGCVILEARAIKSSGDIAAAGGDATAASQEGGDGGTVTFISHDAPTANTGKLDVSGGDGQPKGHAGQSGDDLPWCIG